MFPAKPRLKRYSHVWVALAKCESGDYLIAYNFKVHLMFFWPCDPTLVRNNVFKNVAFDWVTRHEEKKNNNLATCKVTAVLKLVIFSSASWSGVDVNKALNFCGDWMMIFYSRQAGNLSACFWRLPSISYFHS